jgi:CYTH domain-containing protein/predicted ATPase
MSYISELLSSVSRIIITGGPCSGKTTALAHITKFCQDHGFFPVIIPEVATDLISSGFDRTALSFQDFVIEKMLFEEQLRIKAIANGHLPENSVFIYDRWLCDSEAYVGREAFLQVLERHGLSHAEACDFNNGVICLDTAALGAEEFYTLDNNKTREEGLELARTLNEKTKNAWMGAPHFKSIPNRPGVDFHGKMTECLRVLARVLGVPEPLENERWFVTENFKPELLPSHATPIEIEQTYLIGANVGQERVRQRSRDGYHLYYHTLKIPRDDGGSVEIERHINKQSFDEFLFRRDHSRRTIEKTRYCFRHADHYCELDVFRGHRTGLVKLEIEVHEMTDAVTLPLYLGDFVEVTGDKAYSNYALSLPK